MPSSSLTFGPVHLIPDDGSARMAELDALIKKGKHAPAGSSNAICVNSPLSSVELVGIKDDLKIFAMPCELRRLRYLQEAERHEELADTLRLFKMRWYKRKRSSK